jgi:protein TonB
METNKILSADLLDIIFEGKNKEYGAYEIRKTYNRRLIKALLGTGALLLFLCGGYFLSKLRAESIARPVTLGPDIILSKADMPPKKEEPVVIPHAARAQPIQAPTLRDVTVRIVKEEIRDSERPPENAETDNMKIGLTNNLKATGDADILAPPESKGNGVVTAPAQREDDWRFTPVEKEADYPGGLKAWSRYLIKNIRTPDEAISNGISGTVIVQFIVDPEGNVSDVHAISGPTDGGLRAEAERVIRKSGKWTPALQNGRFVKSYKSQPVVFMIDPNS